MLQGLLFARVNPPVVREVSYSGEALAARVAEVGPFPCVRPHVDQHVGPFRKLPPAALERALEPQRAVRLLLPKHVTWVCK